MSVGHFQAHPDGLRELAADFQSAAEELAGRIEGFVGDVFEVGEAFGLIAACKGITDQYWEMVNHTGEGLAELAQVLRCNSSGLNQSAANYDGVDTRTSATLGA
ncbi:WXG100 family type VII secretion target [Streptomyces sp. NPDC056149]|uniref:WXG100 family type VII secretion target n=1 Tax=Streptomyces sp. NPDC056149 TaxID=3345728 RepID=UPI0035DB0A35